MDVSVCMYGKSSRIENASARMGYVDVRRSFGSVSRYVQCGMYCI